MKNGRCHEEKEQCQWVRDQWVRDRWGEDVTVEWLATVGCSETQEVTSELVLVNVE